jgi:hypothetical protein
MLHTDYNRKCSVGKKIVGRDSEGSCLQDELLGGKTASRKVTLTLTVWEEFMYSDFIGWMIRVLFKDAVCSLVVAYLRIRNIMQQ